ncbi:glycosyltransferase, group 2 family protein [Clostridiales bacterium oral taxon 876 str. F0540]|nr:glycosyltransferase, group 2 family protein [Clostridiales bacterium oral taxon 876 str. F0540]
MNNNKICFITCVNDDTLYDENLKYIGSLNIPEGYEIEFRGVKGAMSMTSGYNEAMHSSDAKYKVYLHQDTFVVNKNFLFDMLKVFSSSEKIGIIGVTGTKVIPSNGVWWESAHTYGKVYENHEEIMELLAFNEVKNIYEEVKAIDGLIMITQYDLPWREDIFDGWHFYDVSQSVEFTLKEYKVVIPKQERPWCMHDCGGVNTANGYEKYRNAFLDEYSRLIFPLVSILIPTYNRPDYFKLALESALNQTYRNIEIIIGDDSSNNETEKLVDENYIDKYDNIKYYRNEENLGQFENDIKLFNMAGGEFINYLMDDDLFENQKIEKMMRWFLEDYKEDISLVTSHRAILDNSGNIGSVFGKTDIIFKENTVLNGTEFGNLMLKTNYNFIGEPTTVLFRKNKLEEPFGVYNDRKYGCNVDQAVWFNLLSKGNVIFINEVLSYFRIHDNQQLASDKMKILGALDYAHQVLTAREKGFLIEDEDFNIGLSSSLKYCEGVVNYFDNIGIKEEFIEKIDELRKNCNVFKKLLKKEFSDNSYVEDINRLPLVSILIPAYNQTKYLKEALESAINQTYSNIEIIIGDDSTNDEVERFVKPYLQKYNNITYFKNDLHEMDYGYKNHVKCLLKSNGEYVNYLNHDDVFDPRKIEIMMKCFMENPNITMVTSVRQPIDINGGKIELKGAFSRLFNNNTIISGREISRYVVTNLINCIGEPTTVLFKKKYLRKGFYGYFNEVKFWGIADVANWFTLLEYGDLVYISDVLSYFRIHPDQSTYMPKVYIEGVLSWGDLIENSFKRGIINKYEYRKILNRYFNILVNQLNDYVIENEDIDFELKEKIISRNSKFIRDIIMDN